MQPQTRRGFLGTVGGTAATLALAPHSRAAGANERINVALVGCGGRGPGVAEGMGGVQFVCDPDKEHLGKVAKRFGVDSKNAVTDMRRLFDRKDVDAVIVATPDHWHAPASILACQAGKHVYVEKPCSHNLRESRLLLDAARKNKVVCQHGTQSRSNRLIADGVQLLREGIIGDVLIAKAWNVQRRANIGKAKPSTPPAQLDYDLWVGPAEWEPFQSNRFHYTWHWWYNFGTGDVGNDGTHELDYARWGLGVEGLPSRVVGLGGKYSFDDDQEFPDTANIVFEYPGDGAVGHRRQLIFEMRLWTTNYPHNVDAGAEFYGTKGTMFLSKRGKIEILGERNKRIPATKPKSPAPLKVDQHQEDFLDAIRTNRRPNADIQIAHDSVALVHLGNIAVRTGASLDVDPKTEQILGNPAAARLLTRKYRKPTHWAVPDGV